MESQDRLITKPNIYITIGLIGTGKTTFANKIAEAVPTLIVSKDAIRQMLFGRYRFDQTVEPMINKITDNIITNCITEIMLGIPPYISLVIDEANLTKKDRLSYLHLIRQSEEEYLKPNFFDITYVYFLDEAGNGINRRIQDDRGLSEEHWWSVLNWQMRKIEVPTHQEALEYGIDHMIMVK